MYIWTSYERVYCQLWWSTPRPLILKVQFITRTVKIWLPIVELYLSTHSESGLSVILVYVVMNDIKFSKLPYIEVNVYILKINQESIKVKVKIHLLQQICNIAGL